MISKPLVTILVGLLVGVLTFSCGSGEEEIIYSELKAFNEHDHLQAVIEIPAGTNKKMEYDAKTNSFLQDSINGKPRVVRFLGYPGNYGFIPGTIMKEEDGGDGDPLDVIVLSESVPTGTVMEIVPIGVMEFRDFGKIDNKVVAVPYKTEDRSIITEEYSRLNAEIIKVLELWFMNYKGEVKRNDIRFLGWKNERKAYKEVMKWVVDEDKPDPEGQTP